MNALCTTVLDAICTPDSSHVKTTSSGCWLRRQYAGILQEELRHGGLNLRFRTFTPRAYVRSVKPTNIEELDFVHHCAAFRYLAPIGGLQVRSISVGYASLFHRVGRKDANMVARSRCANICNPSAAEMTLHSEITRCNRAALSCQRHRPKGRYSRWLTD